MCVFGGWGETVWNVVGSGALPVINAPGGDEYSRWPAGLSLMIYGHTPAASEHMTPAKSAAQVYSITLLLEPAEYEYKYYINPGTSKAEWDGDPFRKFFVTNSNLLINDWFGSLTNPLGTDINEKGNLVSIYPNPAKDRLHVESSSSISEVRLVDMLGQVVRNVPVSDHRVQLDVSDLNGGIYFIQVLNAEGMDVQRVQILN